MKYNEKYNRWFTKGGLVYRYDSKQDKLVLCKQSSDKDGYKKCSIFKKGSFIVHRAIYETFVGPIPTGYQIDHINNVRDDNRVENLRAVTHRENMRNPLTIQHKIYSSKSEFGRKYFEHYGYTKYENRKQYDREKQWFYRYGKCTWE